MTPTPVASPKNREEVATNLDYAKFVLDEAENGYILTGEAPASIFKLARVSAEIIADLQLEVITLTEANKRLEDATESLSRAGNAMLSANTDLILKLVEQNSQQKDTIDALRAQLRKAGLLDEA